MQNEAKNIPNGTAYAKALKQHGGGWCLGESKQAGVAKVESMEAGFAPHCIPSTEPEASDRAAGSEARKAGRGKIALGYVGQKKQLLLPTHWGKVLSRGLILVGKGSPGHNRDP